MASRPHVLVPPQTRRQPVDDVEQEVARTAELVLRLTALAERYSLRTASAERVALLRATAALGRRALVELAGDAAPAHRSARA